MNIEKELAAVKYAFKNYYPLIFVNAFLKNEYTIQICVSNNTFPSFNPMTIYNGISISSNIEYILNVDPKFTFIDSDSIIYDFDNNKYYFKHFRLSCKTIIDKHDKIFNTDDIDWFKTKANLQQNNNDNLKGFFTEETYLKNTLKEANDKIKSLESSFDNLEYYCNLIPQEVKDKILNIIDNYFDCFNAKINPKDKDEYFKAYDYAISNTPLLSSNDMVQKFYNFVKEKYLINYERVRLLEIE